MKPKILLSANTNKEYYIAAVNACGGEAYAEYCPEFSDEYDGLILCGGNDIDPHCFGEALDGAVDIDLQRDASEFPLAKAFIAARKPVLGICRGHQMLNVVFGGTLCQNIDSADIHVKHQEQYSVHQVRAIKDGVLSKLYGTEFFVNSAHHQAVKVLGKGLETTLMAENVVEGFEHKSLPVIGVQWHPERMCFLDPNTNMVDGAILFRYFIELCKNNK